MQLNQPCLLLFRRAIAENDTSQWDHCQVVLDILLVPWSVEVAMLPLQNNQE